MRSRLTYRTHLLLSKAQDSVDALGESLRYQLRCSFIVLSIRLSALLAAALRFIQVRKSWTRLGLKLAGQRGFAMPTVIVLMSLMSIIAFAALMQANSGLTLAYKQAYIQMARIGSKAAVDYAQEQFDTSLCGSYNGTTETDLVSNDRYRVTFKAEVIETSTDGLEKTIKGTGSVYLPKLSTVAQYVFDIRSEIVRTYAACKTPDNFNPLVWLDASDVTSLKHQDVTTTTVSVETTFGNATDTVRDTVEELVSNGGQTTNSWQSNDLEMHRCDSAEFSSSICNSTSTRYLYTGLVFQNVNVPQNATITAATLEFSGGTPSGTSGSVTHRTYGIYKAADNLHPDLFSQGLSNQVRTPITTNGLHTSAYADVTTNNFPPGNTTVFNIQSVAQEIVNNSNWDPNTGGGRMGFGIYRTTGNGSRRALKDGVRLSITYTTAGGTTQANNGESISEWSDQSANQYHARFGLGTAPTRVDNQINGQTVARFNDGALLSTLTTALSGKREMTILAVIKGNYGTSDNDGRVVSGMTSTGTNDTSGSNAIIPFLRYNGNSGFSSLYTGSSSTYRTNYTCSAACGDTPYIYSSIFSIADTNNTITGTLKGNGAVGTQKTGMNPSGSPYTFGINQLYFGGRRSGAMPGTGADYFNGDYGEIIVYDYALGCRDIESLEDYLRSKWRISATAYTTTCPADTVPTL